MIASMRTAPTTLRVSSRCAQLDGRHDHSPPATEAKHSGTVNMIAKAGSYPKFTVTGTKARLEMTCTGGYHGTADFALGADGAVNTWGNFPLVAAARQQVTATVQAIRVGGQCGSGIVTMTKKSWSQGVPPGPGQMSRQGPPDSVQRFPASASPFGQLERPNQVLRANTGILERLRHPSSRVLVDSVRGDIQGRRNHVACHWDDLHNGAGGSEW